MGRSVRAVRWQRIGGAATLAALLACGGGGDGSPADGAAADAPVADSATDGGSDAGHDAGSSCPPALGEPEARSPVEGVGHPMDDTLRLDHLQAKGTHNSYHVAQPSTSPSLDYTHAPLEEQLDTQGVRAVELDLWYDRFCERHEVFHSAGDDATRCELFTDCLRELRSWSDAHPGHHPLFVQIEPKDLYREERAAAQLEAMDREILSVWPRELVITPDEVRGEHDTLAEAIETDGWPTLGEVRGHVLFFMNRSDALRDDYTHGRTSLEGRVMFAEGSESDPWAAVLVLNDPLSSGDRIRAAVQAGRLVRTRADADAEEGRTEDTSRREAALASGAHVISTDFPTPSEDTSYYVEMPGGTPSRCNPVSAPDGCTAEAIEDPARLSP